MENKILKKQNKPDRASRTPTYPRELEHEHTHDGHHQHDRLERYYLAVDGT